MIGIRPKRLFHFILAYVYLIVIAFVTIQFNLSLYASTFLYMLLPACFLGYKLHRERRFLFEALLFSVPAIITVDLIGHVSKSWDYWRSEIFGFYLGPYPFIGFFWGFSFWLAVVVFYEYFYDGSAGRKTPPRERYIAFIASVAAAIFLLTYTGQVIPFFYLWIIVLAFVLSTILIIKYRYNFWKSYLPVLGLLPASLLYEYISLRAGHWIFDQSANIVHLNYFGYSLPIEEILWFLIIQHYIILFHETFADNQKM